jgi:uncharacterized protein (TIGR00255 family)
MTGYGRGSSSSGERALLCELRSYNHRFLELKLRLPWTDPVVETNLRQLVRSRIDRGVVWITVEEGHGGPQDVRIDWDRARAYVHAFSELKRGLAIEAPITLELLAAQPGVLSTGDGTLTGQALWEAFEPALDAALKDLVHSREREGVKLKADLDGRLRGLERLAQLIGEKTHETPELQRKRMRDRLERILKPGVVDENRLAQDFALLADRVDTTEELTRLRAHLEELSHLFSQSTPVGRKVDFLIQELNREVNTIGSKAQSGQVAALVVDAKAEVERLREQSQNIE